MIRLMKRGKYEDIITDIQNDKTIGTKVLRVGYETKEKHHANNRNNTP